MKTTSYHDASTGLEIKRILYDGAGNYLCEINWHEYFDKNPSSRPAKVGEDFLDNLACTLS
jgi:hypothetical protein